VPLLERGADPNVRNPTGSPMILLAAASEAMPVDAIKALIARGADVNAANPFGETALTVAQRHGDTPVVDLLRQAGAKPSGPVDPQPAPSPAASTDAAIARSLPLLQRADVAFLRTAGCVSCHNNSLTATTVALARAHRRAVDESIATGQKEKVANYIEDWRERSLQMQGIPGDHDSMSAILDGLAAERHAPDWSTEAIARFIRYQQAPDGRWPVFAHRPPIESGDVKITVEALAALRAYGTGLERGAFEAAIARGNAWLAQAKPDSLLERAHLLIGLRDADASKASLSAAAAPLLAQQRPDGGWAQLPTLKSDAYATGLVLTALLQSGVTPRTDRAVTRGVAFLLQTQMADGSWYVARRAMPIQPYFDAQFPYGRDQFISTAATNWATQALILVNDK
jgi:hypothetical protein